MIRLKLQPPLTRLVGAPEILVDLPRSPLRRVLERALGQDARLQRALLDPAGELSHEYACLVNGARYNVADLGDVEVDAADDITLLLPIAGGAGPAPAIRTGGYTVAPPASPPEARTWPAMTSRWISLVPS